MFSRQQKKTSKGLPSCSPNLSPKGTASWITKTPSQRPFTKTDTLRPSKCTRNSKKAIYWRPKLIRGTTSSIKCFRREETSYGVRVRETERRRKICGNPTSRTKSSMPFEMCWLWRISSFHLKSKSLSATMRISLHQLQHQKTSQSLRRGTLTKSLIKSRRKSRRNWCSGKYLITVKISWAAEMLQLNNTCDLMC